MNKYKGFIYIGFLIAFYLLPNFISDTGSGMFILLMAVPLVVFCLSVIYGILVGFNWYFWLIVGVLFIPSIFIFYNDTALIYTGIYSVISLIGHLSGTLLQKLIKRKNN